MEQATHGFLTQLDALRAEKGADLTLADIRQALDKADTRFVQGIQTIAEKIQTVKSTDSKDISAAITQDVIPGANLELDAVVSAAEEATNRILDAAEAVQTEAAKAPAEVAEAVSVKVMDIFEACNFQDITGQRIANVVKTLLDVERIITTLLAVLSGDASLEELERALAQAAAEDEGDAALMNGPQLEEDAPSQEEVDRLFADA